MLIIAKNLIFMIFIFILLISCGNNKSSQKLEAKFSSIENQVLQPTCVRSGCHQEPAVESGLILEKGKAYQDLINRKSREMPEVIYVVPNHPEESYLIQKLEGGKIVGDQMPMGRKPLGQDTIKIISDWIAAGAPRN
jgi:hypothetical protein